MSGYSLATSSNTSSQSGMEWLRALDLVAAVTRFLPFRFLASSKANRITLSAPLRVMTDIWIAISTGVPAWRRPPHRSTLPRCSP